MTKFELFKFIHVLAGIVWVGGGITAQILALRLKTASPEYRLGYARDMRFAAQFIFLPAALVSYIFGELMIAEVEPVYTHEQAWITIATIGVFVSFLTVATFMVPQIRKAVRLMEAGEGPAAAKPIRRVTLAARGVLVILLVVVWAMITKPGV